MASSDSYQHKKFDLKTEEYSHKKFGVHSKKRKNIELEEENKENLTAQTILDLANKEPQTELAPQAKRKQTKALFRPWLNGEEDKKQEEENHNISSPPLDKNPQQSVLPRALTKQQRPKRPALIQQHNRQNIPLSWQHHQYALFYQQHQLALMQQHFTNALYLRQLQQLALQRHQQQQQQRVFVFGQQ